MMELGNPEKKPSPPLNALHGQRLVIPDLRPVFAAWKQGINPLHGRVKLAVDARLARLIEDKRVLEKLKAVDIGLFAAGWVFPSSIFCLLPRFTLILGQCDCWAAIVDWFRADGSLTRRMMCWRPWRYTVFGPFSGTMPLTALLCLQMAAAMDCRPPSSTVGSPWRS